ncbi:ABC transporter permease [Clostridium sp. DL1XJH146]
MNFFESLKMAFDSILANKMRSFLTMLGIIIGISSVIAILALGSGGTNSITGEFEKIGASAVVVSVDGKVASGSDYITDEDIESINKNITGVKYLSPSLSTGGRVITDTKSFSISISGGNDFYDEANALEMVYGRFYNLDEVNSGKLVTIIDETSAENLFGYTNAVGETIKVKIGENTKLIKIIGITESVTNFGPPQDEYVIAYMPYTSFETLTGKSIEISNIRVIAETQDEAEGVGNSIVSLLESRHRNEGQELYEMQNVFAMLEQINSVLGIFTTFISAVAGISLLVGGIGVMNIMLVSVTERTREIGIRKAIGATTGNILMQFLTESAILTMIGGIIGIILGVSLASIAGGFMDVVPEFSATSILLTILFSSSIGIFFGIYPARKAAKLKPIDALRYE